MKKVDVIDLLEDLKEFFVFNNESIEQSKYIIDRINAVYYPLRKELDNNERTIL